jgi:hypothetical protein
LRTSQKVTTIPYRFPKEIRKFRKVIAWWLTYPSEKYESMGRMTSMIIPYGK